MKKTCSVCGEEKLATREFFHPNRGGKFGLRRQCRLCRRAIARANIKLPEVAAKRKAVYAAYVSSGRAAARNRLWRAANPGASSAATAAWKLRNKERADAYDRKWRAEHREMVRAKQRRADAKLQKSPEHVLKKRIKARLRQMLKGKALGGSESILGYTKVQLVAHLEKQFTPGMSWDRLIAGEIHLDHIVPVSAFEIREIGDAEFRACWSLANLRPMWARDNQTKQAKRLTLL